APPRASRACVRVWRSSRAGDEPDESARVGVQLGRLGRPSERLGDYEGLAAVAGGRGGGGGGRLAYVAATRAKRRLILSGTFNPKRLDQDLTGGSSLRSEHSRINRRKRMGLQS